MNEDFLRAACKTAEERYWEAYFSRIDAEAETEPLQIDIENHMQAAFDFYKRENKNIESNHLEPKPCHPGKMLKAMLIIALLAALTTAVSASDAAPSVAPCDQITQAANEIVTISSDELSFTWTKVQATNGAYGYVRESELTAYSPASPDDTHWKRFLWGNRKKREIDVYDADGVTIIGSYRVG